MQYRGHLYLGERVLFNTDMGELALVLQELDAKGDTRLVRFLVDDEEHEFRIGARAIHNVLGGLSIGIDRKVYDANYGDGVAIWATIPNAEKYTVDWPAREE